MKRISLIISLLLTLLFVNSCVDYSNDLDSLNYNSTLVIEGLVLDTAGKSFVKVSLSAPNGDSIDNYPISNATVIMLEDNIKSDSFKLTSPGLYINPAFCGKVNSNYTLLVNYEGTIYTAVSKLLPVSTIDSLIYEITDSLTSTAKEYKIVVYAGLTSHDYTSYYKIKLYKNDTLYNSYRDLLIFDDVYLKSFQNVELGETYRSGDKVKVEVFSLTHEVYTYFEELSGLTNGNLNSIYFYPQNPETNISNGALGIFQASSVSSNEITLP